MLRKIIFFIFLVGFSTLGLAQKVEQNAASSGDKGTLSGDFEMNNNFYMKDSLIGAAAPIPQYVRQFSSTDAWLNLNYRSTSGWDIGARLDLFNNSNLYNPNESYSAKGIGRFYIKKRMALPTKNKQYLDISAGYQYDQIGNGFIFRAFESRPLFIDNALMGASVNYLTELSEKANLRAKFFSGKQKRVDGQKDLLDVYEPLIMGGSVEAFWKPSDSTNFSIAPGIGMVKRTLDDITMNDIVAGINNDSLQYRFVPRYNTYSATIYNTMNYKNLTWSFEAAYKTEEAIPDDVRQLAGTFKLKNSGGSVLYTSLSYATEGFGVTLQARRIDNFFWRTTPFPLPGRASRGQISFLPAIQRQSTYRLTSRYTIGSIESGEMAVMGDVNLTPSDKLSLMGNFTYVDDLNGQQLQREGNLEATYKINSKQKIILGGQFVRYNQKVYQVKSELDKENSTVVALTPYVEYIHKLNRKHSFRAELQYMQTTQDLGPWAFALFEYNISPSWSFTGAMLINTVPHDKGHRKLTASGDFQSPILYPTLAVFYTMKATRLSVSYVKQPEGVVCTGGICRLEPAFSGIKANIVTRF